MDEQIKLGFQFANELSKQLLTLSTGVLALSVTFTKDILKGSPGAGVVWLKGAWLSLLLTIIFAVAHMHAITGHLLPEKYAEAKNIGLFGRVLGGAELLAFLAGIVMLLIFGAISMRAARGADEGEA